MPATHQIDRDNRLIITRWHGEPTAGDLIDALGSYQQEIRNRDEFVSYDDLLDFGDITGTALTTENIRTLGTLATATDQPSVKTRLAIIVNSTLAYGLSRMYAIYRDQNPGSNKEIQVFKDRAAAMAWLRPREENIGTAEPLVE